MDKLIASEALYGFMAWLTTRDEVVSFGSTHDCAVAVDLIVEFSKVNSLEGPRDTWPEGFIMPTS